jgi:hypothetical protein
VTHIHHGPTSGASDYKIEKIRCPVTVTLTDGTQLRGDIFVRPVSRFHPGPQDAGEFLNEADAYFALAASGEPPMLVSKENVLRAEAPLPDVDDEGVDEVRLGLNIQITLVGGQICRGTVFIETPVERARLIDFLNGHPTRFLTLFDPQKMTLVNRRVVAHVREAN